MAKRQRDLLSLCHTGWTVKEALEAFQEGLPDWQRRILPKSWGNGQMRIFWNLFPLFSPNAREFYNLRVVWEPFPALCTSEWVDCTTICRRLLNKNKDKTFEHLWKHIWFLLKQKNCSTLVKLLPTKFKIFHKFTWPVDGCLSAEV